MTLKLIKNGPPPPSRPSRNRQRIGAKQVRGIEDPATVILTPMALLPRDLVKWWSYDEVLLGGIKFNGTNDIDAETPGDQARVGYLPIPIPRSWGEAEFGVVIEYEAESLDAQFRFRLFYGCGDPSELYRGESDLLTGHAGGGKRRMLFKLDPDKLKRNELFRVTVEVHRMTPHHVLIYGAWLEVGV
tara:strand:+ start:668 stop:1228 length:561 start_codon:yes stop_codon:yes gene_type:complete